VRETKRRTRYTAGLSDGTAADLRTLGAVHFTPAKISNTRTAREHHGRYAGQPAQYIASKLARREVRANLIVVVNHSGRVPAADRVPGFLHDALYKALGTLRNQIHNNTARSRDKLSGGDADCVVHNGRSRAGGNRRTKHVLKRPVEEVPAQLLVTRENAKHNVLTAEQKEAGTLFTYCLPGIKSIVSISIVSRLGVHFRCAVLERLNSNGALKTAVVALVVLAVTAAVRLGESYVDAHVLHLERTVRGSNYNTVARFFILISSCENVVGRFHHSGRHSGAKLGGKRGYRDAMELHRAAARHFRFHIPFTEQTLITLTQVNPQVVLELQIQLAVQQDFDRYVPVGNDRSGHVHTLFTKQRELIRFLFILSVEIIANEARARTHTSRVFPDVRVHFIFYAVNHSFANHQLQISVTLTGGGVRFINPDHLTGNNYHQRIIFVIGFRLCKVSVITAARVVPSNNRRGDLRRGSAGVERRLKAQGHKPTANYVDISTSNQISRDVNCPIKLQAGEHTLVVNAIRGVRRYAIET